MSTGMFTLRSDYQGFTLPPHQTTTAHCHTTHCDVVLIACLKSSKFILCNTGSGDVQKSTIWGLGRIGGNADEVEISTVSTTQCPPHSDIHSSTDISRESNTGDVGGSGGA